MTNNKMTNAQETCVKVRDLLWPYGNMARRVNCEFGGLCDFNALMDQAQVLGVELLLDCGKSAPDLVMGERAAKLTRPLCALRLRHAAGGAKVS